MLLRSIQRKKDGKDYRYYSIVENYRMASDKTVQRTVLYLGENNDQQQAAWRKTLSLFDEEQQAYSNLSLFPTTARFPPKQLGLEEFWESLSADRGKKSLAKKCCSYWW